MESAKKKVLVTGATGLVGSSLCEKLAGQGYLVVGLVFGDESNLKDLARQENFCREEGDIRRSEQLNLILQKHKPDVVFHTAALLPTGKEKAEEFLAVNTQGTHHLLEVCRQSGVFQIVYSSSMSVYGHDIQYLPVDEKHPTQPFDMYSVTKLQGEQLCQLYAKVHGFRVAILRYSGVYGVKKTSGAVAAFFKNALSGEPLQVTGDTRWDLVSVKDVVGANMLAFEHIEKMQGEVFNIGSGEETGVKELAEKIKAITQSSSSIEEKPSSEPSFRFVYDISKAREKLGFQPQSLVQGLEDYYREIQGV